MGGGPPPPGPLPPQTEVTIVGTNEIYNRQNLVGPFLVHKLLGLSPSPRPLPLFKYIPGHSPYQRETKRRATLWTVQVRGRSPRPLLGIRGLL